MDDNVSCDSRILPGRINENFDASKYDGNLKGDVLDVILRILPVCIQEKVHVSLSV